ncbi:DMT family transporter [Brevibacillus sp. H7]|uniref:DMT family transporter n=1 Tax=Brevibacillus sp. H7 TaxID=3349138 RepID=UPI00381F9D07
METQSSRQQTRISLLLLLVPLFWGGAFGAAKHVITEIPSITAAALRFGLAGLILLAVALFKSEWNLASLRLRWRGLLLMALTGIFAYNAFFFLALRYTSAINGSLIMATTPVFMTVGAVLFLQEPWNKRLGLGLALSLAGVILVILKGSLHTLFSLTFNLGDLLFSVALISWVVHSLIGKVVMKGVSPLFATTVTTTVGSIPLLFWSVWEGGWGNVLAMSGQSWMEMVYMVVCATVVAFFLWNRGIHQIGASKASMYMNLVPINAAWIAVLFYDSSIGWQQVIGIVLVILGVFVSTFSPPEKAKNREKAALPAQS